MGLNLDSLKNLATPATPNISHNNSITLATHEKPSTEKPIIETLAKQSLVQAEKIPSTGPKISLMKLKQWTQADNKPEMVKAPIYDELSVAEIEKSSTPTTQTEWSIEEVKEIKIQQTTPEVTEVKIPEEMVITKVQESQSISIDMLGEKEHAEIEVIEEPKEVFPNLHVSLAMNLEDDLLEFQDIITDNDTATRTSNLDTKTVLIEVISEIEETSSEIITTEAVGVAENTETIKWEILINPKVSELPSVPKSSSEALFAAPEIVAITPAYIAEVKTELSEGRRAGFRFFVQQKTKIIAWVGIVSSLALIAVFSGSLLGSDIPKTGKTNVQEQANNTQTEASNIEAVNTASVIEESSYEVGRDYSVAKNTKKNVSSKNTPSTSSGTEIPTP